MPNREVLNEQLNQTIAYTNQLLADSTAYFQAERRETRYPELLETRLRELEVFLHDLKARVDVAEVADFQRSLSMMFAIRMAYDEVSDDEGGVTPRTDEFSGHLLPMLSNMERWMKVCIQQLNR